MAGKLLRHDAPLSTHRLSTPGLTRTEVRDVLARIEREVQASPETCITLAPDGHATLTAGGRTYAAGRFTTPTIGELRARLATLPKTPGARLTFSEATGDRKHVDIGELQATAPPRTLFQVASQFNCLESPGARVVRIAEYVDDPTQGPGASVSAFPGTFLRHYRAPDGFGGHMVQQDGACLNLLRSVVAGNSGCVNNGYLLTSTITDPAALARELTENLEGVAIGVHEDVEVVLGGGRGGAVPSPGPRIAQVFTSTIALGSYGADNGSDEIATIRRQLLRAAYLGTLLAAIGLGMETVYLTLIGGGVFANPHDDIQEAMRWSVSEAGHHVRGDLTVRINGRLQTPGLHSAADDHRT